jgi:hypothetical protein
MLWSDPIAAARQLAVLNEYAQLFDPPRTARAFAVPRDTTVQHAPRASRAPRAPLAA